MEEKNIDIKNNSKLRSNSLKLNFTDNDQHFSLQFGKTILKDETRPLNDYEMT